MCIRDRGINVMDDCENLGSLKGMYCIVKRNRFIFLNKDLSCLLYTSLVSMFRKPLLTIKFSASIMPIKKPEATMAGMMGTKISPSAVSYTHLWL